ncbi:hypothetical protein STEG23_024641, partial [Scotinomys teguina]
IGYWKDAEPEDSAETVRTRGNESFVMLTGLEGDTLYHLTVRAYNGAGYGPPSGEVSATTKRPPPSEPPGNLRWEQQGSQVSLGWEPVRPLANESEVMGYKKGAECPKDNWIDHKQGAVFPTESGVGGAGPNESPLQREILDPGVVTPKINLPFNYVELP